MTDTALDHRSAALGRRYGTAEADRAAQSEEFVWNEVLATQLAHRSVRKFLPDTVSEGQLRAIVAAASSTASSSNLQLWSVVAVTDRDRLGRIAALAGNQDAVRNAPLLLVWVADLARAGRIAEQNDRDLVNAGFVESALLGVVDATLAAQNAALAAESLGLGTVYIGAIRNHPIELAEELNLPAHSFAVVGLVVGHPDPAESAEVKPRLGVDVVLHRERYDLAAQEAGIAEYDVRISGFYREQGLPDGWIDRVVGRFATPGALGAREGLREALERRGFDLV
ncbi:nitroreductase family protein [Rhodococcus phenolicus]|uniref:nitroreductase family protein n=1 Tax=Rhodococcus phenolicus TaxID=263849 RepID=UPI0008317AB0|nr:nitroreductase family protein [Rhodococcus phenolicus]